MVHSYTVQVGTRKKFKKNCGMYVIQTFFKGNRTLKNLLASDKNNVPKEQRSANIYWYRCQELDNDDECIGESARTFWERSKEHLKVPSPMHGHQSTTGHPTMLDTFSIVGKKGQRFTRTRCPCF